MTTTEPKPSLNPYNPNKPGERLAHMIHNLGHAAGACGWQPAKEDMQPKHAAIYMEGYHVGNVARQESCRKFWQIKHGVDNGN